MSGSSAVFDAAFAITVGAEGGYSNNQSDPGNWTGGAVGQGALNGTKFGVSAASYPTLDIVDLTEDDAKSIYQRDYWSKVGGDALPPLLAVLVFDAAVNNGVGRASTWLQQALGVTADGQIGPQSLAAIGAIKDVGAVATAFHAARLAFMTNLSTWSTFGAAVDGRPLGWAKRLASLPYQAAQVAASVGSLPALTLV